MIKTIIFDLGEVYLKGFKGVENSLEKELKINSAEIYKNLRVNNYLNSLFLGKITEEKYLDLVIRKNKWKIEKILLKDIIRNNFQEVQGTRKIIEKLRLKGYKLGLLSVHTKEWIDYCEKKFDYHRLFHSVLYSFEFSIAKPNKRAYNLILKKLHTKAEECLFIDDLEKNLESAIELGMKAILFKNAKQLKKELKLYKINI